jgi:hypothetical protein
MDMNALIVHHQAEASTDPGLRRRTDLNDRPSSIGKPSWATYSFAKRHQFVSLK